MKSAWVIFLIIDDFIVLERPSSNIIRNLSRNFENAPKR